MCGLPPHLPRFQPQQFSPRPHYQQQHNLDPSQRRFTPLKIGAPYTPLKRRQPPPRRLRGVDAWNYLGWGGLPGSDIRGPESWGFTDSVYKWANAKPRQRPGWIEVMPLESPTFENHQYGGPLSLDLEVLDPPLASLVQSDFLSKHPEWAIKNRIDGLPRIIPLFVYEHRFPIHVFPQEVGAGKLPLAHDKTDVHFYKKPNVKNWGKFAPRFRETVHAEVKKVQADREYGRKYKDSIQNNGVQFAVRLREDVLCVSLESSKTYERRVLPMRASVALLYPILLEGSTGRNVRVTTDRDPAPVMLSGSIPVTKFPTQAEDFDSLAILHYWEAVLEASGDTKYDREELVYGEWPGYNAQTTEDGELFEFACPGPELFDHKYQHNRNTYDHCATLPVSATKMLPWERVKIGCGQRYPAGTKVVYRKLIQQQQKAVGEYLWFERTCGKDGWEHPEELKAEEGPSHLAECVVRLNTPDLYNFQNALTDAPPQSPAQQVSPPRKRTHSPQQ